MKFVSFHYTDTYPRAGLLLGTLVIDLAAAAPLVFETVEPARWTLLDVLNGVPDGMGIEGATEIAAAVLDQLGVADLDELIAVQDEGTFVGLGFGGALSIGGTDMVMPLADVRLLAPVPQPPSLRDFYAFEAHVAATAALRNRPVPPAWYRQPAFYFGNHATIYGPDAHIPYPRTAELDYELEVACVIGRAGRDIHEDDGEAHIAGLLIMNDWSARDVQREEMSIGLGPAKAKDFATSLGPMLVTLDELDHARRPDGRFDLAMTAKVNGVERSRGNLREMFYTFGQLVAHASRDVMLQPGDILGSGTVGSGCLLELTYGDGPWLLPDDDVELAVEGLGVLRNQIIP